MSNRKSKKDIFDFYKLKNKDVLTLKFFPLWKKNLRGNEYSKLYDDFCTKKFSEVDNESLYRVLEAYLEPEKASFPIKRFNHKEIQSASEIPNLEFLNDIGVDHLNPNNNNGEYANQKWHLFVCVFAYEVVCNIKFSWNQQFPLTYRCLPLRLWMIENADMPEVDLKRIDEAIATGYNEAKQLIDGTFIRLFGGGV